MDKFFTRNSNPIPSGRGVLKCVVIEKMVYITKIIFKAHRDKTESKSQPASRGVDGGKDVS